MRNIHVPSPQPFKREDLPNLVDEKRYMLNAILPPRTSFASWKLEILARLATYIEYLAERRSPIKQHMYEIQTYAAGHLGLLR